MVRVRLDLGYDGSGFAGWAVQPGLRTVQGVLTPALATVLRTDVALTVAGRTDAGVHATGQVAHLDVPPEVWGALPGRAVGRSPADALLARLGGVLPPDVRVHGVSVAAPGFDARFAALSRRYEYRICDDPAGVPPLRRHDVVAHRRSLDADLMTAAAAGLVGLRDFAAFCRRREGATTVRTLLEYAWDRDEQGFLVARVVADAFCHSMVRALVGAVLPVGEGRRPVSWPAEVQAAAVRDPAVTVAPAHGLTLVEVEYPPDDALEARVSEARAVRELPGPP